MRRKILVQLSPAERLQELKHTVFHKYALTFLENLCEKKTELVTIRDYNIENHGGRKEKAIRTLVENNVIRRVSGDQYGVNLSLFDKEAAPLAELDRSQFQLSLKYLFKSTINPNGYGYSDKIDFNTIGAVKISRLSMPSALWVYFNQEKVKFLEVTHKSSSHTYEEKMVSLKNSDEEVLQARLLYILFKELKDSPTEYLAEYTGTPWVGKLSRSFYLSHHDAKSIIKDHRNMARAEREIREMSQQLEAYANMLKHIRSTFGKDRVKGTIEFLKFLINKMLVSAPLKVTRRAKENEELNGYKFILEHTKNWNFDFLFPDGLSEEIIKNLTKEL